MAVEDSRIFTFNVTNASFFNNGTKFSNVTFQIPRFIIRHKDNVAVYLSIENACIPSSWYNVPENTQIQIINSATNSSSTFTIPPGNYDAFTLCSTINSNWTMLNSWNLKFVYNLIGNKLSLQWTGTAFAGLVGATNSSILGLNASSYIPLNTTPNSSTVFPNQVNLTGVNTYLIVCDEAPTQNYSLQLSGNIIGSIQNSASNFGITLWENTSALKYLIPLNRQIDQITIRIYNERGELINFNNVGWNLTIKVTYQKSKITSAEDLLQFMHSINQFDPQLQDPAQSKPDVLSRLPDAVP